MTFIKKIGLLLLLCHIPVLLQAQSGQYSNRMSINFELAGTGGLYSTALEWRLKHKLNFWQGVTFYGSAGTAFLVFPTVLKKEFGEKNSRFEAGLGHGLTFYFDKGIKIGTRGLIYVGYKYQKSTKPWIFRASYTPYISYILDFQYQNWLGVSVGYQLKSK